MKYYVWEKSYREILICMIGFAVFLAFFVFIFLLEGFSTFIASLHPKSENFYLVFGTIMFFTIMELACLFLLWVSCSGAKVSFEETSVKCIFLNKTRRNIYHNEIIDYGIFFKAMQGTGWATFIYLSRVVIPKNNISRDAYRMFVKTKDVIIVQYMGKNKDKIIELLEKHVPNFDIDRLYSTLPDGWDMNRKFPE